MKKIFLILIAVLNISCNENQTTSTANEVKSATKSPEKIHPQEIDKLVGTWYVKELLINGKPDPENFPVNNDELTLNQDMSAISVDKTFNMEDRGKWERLSDEQFAVITDDERVVFQILKLTDTEFETKMVTDEVDMVINYKKEK
ncbi:MAG: hypothetical protein KF905_13715 [Flavobacteriales bacterium]|nr:hypothetical protein [Flavobacteriales bacterium]